MAAAAACVSFVRLSGDGPGFNITLVLKEIALYKYKFGLPDEGNDKFKALSEESSALLSKYSGDANSFQHEFLMLPTTSSFRSVHNFLSNCINDMEKVALDIWNATVKLCSK